MAVKLTYGLKSKFLLHCSQPYCHFSSTIPDVTQSMASSKILESSGIVVSVKDFRNDKNINSICLSLWFIIHIKYLSKFQQKIRTKSTKVCRRIDKCFAIKVTIIYRIISVCRT